MNYTELILKIPIDGSADEIRRSLSDIVEEAGFDAFCYVAGRVVGPATSGQAIWAKTPTVVTTFRDDWIQEYHRNDYSKIDPAVQGALTQRVPVVWDSDSPPPSLTARQAKFLSDAADFDVRRGLTIPIYGPMGDFGLFSLISRKNGRQFQSLIERRSHAARLVALYFHEWVRKFTPSGSSRIPLTAREREVLHWAAAGKTNAETGTILGISQKTAQFHLYNSMRKLGVYNKPQAVVAAIRDGLIAP